MDEKEPKKRKCKEQTCDLKGSRLQFQLPVSDEGPIQRATLELVELLRNPPNLPGIKSVELGKYQRYTAGYEKIAKPYEKFTGGDFILDGLPGSDPDAQMPPGFDRNDELTWVLDDVTWLVDNQPPPTNGKDDPFVKGKHKGFRLVQKGKKQANDDANCKDENEMIFMYKPSQLRGERYPNDKCQNKVHEIWGTLKEAITRMMELHPDIEREEQARGFFEVFVRHGVRADQNFSMGKYVHTKKKRSEEGGEVTEEDKIDCGEKVQFLLQKLSEWLVTGLPPSESRAFRTLLRHIKADVLLFKGEEQELFWGSVAVAINYISWIHSEAHFSWSAMGCIDLDNLASDGVVTHIVFPDYKVAVALRSGDLLLFDSRVRHCLTNPRNPKGVTFTAFNNMRTMATYYRDYKMAEEAKKGEASL